MIVIRKPVIILEKGEKFEYHHVGDLDSGMCYLTDKNGKPVYAGGNDFVLFEEYDKER